MAPSAPDAVPASRQAPVDAEDDEQTRATDSPDGLQPLRRVWACLRPA